MNHYEVLQISQTATEDEIKRAYQKLARKHHPDKSQEENGDKFDLIDKVYKVLRDPVRRKVYDSELFQKTSSHLIIHDTIQRSDFAYDEEEKIFYYQCKCGSFYTLDNDISTTTSSTEDDLILSCDECSLNIKVKS